MKDSFDLNSFVDALASGAPTPGGGSASALAGALAASLAAMVGRVTLGRKRYADVHSQMEQVVAEAERLRAQLLALVSEDAAAYDRVSQAYRLPRASVADQAARQAAIQQALKGASRTPRATMEACLEVLRLLHLVADLGNLNAATDAQVAALLAQAGLQGAALNVEVNLADIDDAQFVGQYRTAVKQMLDQAAHLVDQIMTTVEQRRR